MEIPIRMLAISCNLFSECLKTIFRLDFCFSEDYILLIENIGGAQNIQEFVNNKVINFKLLPKLFTIVIFYFHSQLT